MSSLAPAGHILGSAQAVLAYKGQRIVVSGDYKRRPDPTCPPFEPIPCDVFITEATFALPVFHHPSDMGEIGKLLRSVATFPERTHLVGVYALGKCQRVIKLLRAAGYDKRIWLHGALPGAVQALPGAWRRSRRHRAASPTPSSRPSRAPSCSARPRRSPTAGRGASPIRCPAVASGWMRVRARARQRGAELPLVISDHADWAELTADPEGRRRAQGLGDAWPRGGAGPSWRARIGIDAEALHLAGREEEGA